MANEPVIGLDLESFRTLQEIVAWWESSPFRKQTVAAVRRSPETVIQHSSATDNVRCSSTTTTGGYYPGKVQTFNGSTSTYTDVGDCWLQDRGGATLTLRKYDGRRSGVYSDKPVYLVDVAGAVNVINGSTTVSGIANLTFNSGFFDMTGSGTSATVTLDPITSERVVIGNSTTGFKSYENFYTSSVLGSFNGLYLDDTNGTGSDNHFVTISGPSSGTAANATLYKHSLIGYVDGGPGDSSACYAGQMHATMSGGSYEATTNFAWYASGHATTGLTTDASFEIGSDTVKINVSVEIGDSSTRLVRFYGSAVSGAGQCPSIADATGGSTVDTEARTAINTLLEYLRNRGDVEPLP